MQTILNSSFVLMLIVVELVLNGYVGFLHDGSIGTEEFSNIEFVLIKGKTEW